MSAAKLCGLILTGGQSTRMGRDKALISYHGEPQALHAARLLREFCAAVFLSCRPDQARDAAFCAAFADMPLILDTQQAIGPIAGLLSATESDPQAAWLVLACDMPNVDSTLLAALVAQRDTDKRATIFARQESSGRILLEPLCTIYEPHGLAQLHSGIPQPRFGLQGWLQQWHQDGQLKLLALPQTQAHQLMSLNTPEEARGFPRDDSSRPDVP